MFGRGFFSQNETNVRLFSLTPKSATRINKLVDIGLVKYMHEAYIKLGAYERHRITR